MQSFNHHRRPGESAERELQSGWWPCGCVLLVAILFCVGLFFEARWQRERDYEVVKQGYVAGFEHADAAANPYNDGFLSGDERKRRLWAQGWLAGYHDQTIEIRVRPPRPTNAK